MEETTLFYLAVTLIGGLFTIVGFFFVRTLRKIDTNQSEMFKQLNALSQEFYQLKGEHNTYVNLGKHLRAGE